MNKKGEIKILHVKNKIFAVIPSKYFTYSMADPENFVDFIQNLREEYPNHKMRCVLDEELEKKLESRLLMQKAVFCFKGVKNERT
nr:MAG TPA: hypothetical protein [Caudoviricetes sp.]